MKQKKALLIGMAMLVAAMTVLPYFASAAATVRSNVFDITILKGPILVCSGGLHQADGTTANQNTCQNLCDFIAQIAQVIYFVIALVIWIITPLLVAVGGVMYMLAGANPGMVERAKKTITGAVWGIAIVLCAWILVYTFIHIFGNLSSYVFGFGQTACQV